MINKQNTSFLKKYPMDTYNGDTLCKRFITNFYHARFSWNLECRFYMKFNYLTYDINKFLYDFKNNK